MAGRVRYAMSCNISDSSPAATVSCRPSAEWWAWVGLAIFFALMGGLAAILPSNPPPLHPVVQAAFFGVVSIACLLGAALAAWWMFQARMEADADGLRWRRFGGWKSARWEEVRGFYDRLPAQSQAGRSSLRAIIKTSSGTISFSSEWANADSLREQVERRATNAAVQQWGLLGSRPCDPWPRVFRYDTWQNIWTPRVLLKLVLTALGYLLTKPLQQVVGTVGQAGWGMTLAGLGVYVLLIASMGAVFLMPLAQYRAAGRRKAERITADTDGIVFEDGARRVEAAWADVTGYGTVPGPGALGVRYLVETRRGDFDFLAVLDGATLLQAIIRRYAEDAADEDWRPRVNPEALGGEAARWSGGRVGVGARVYHYGRARTGRCCGSRWPCV